MSTFNINKKKKVRNIGNNTGCSQHLFLNNVKHNKNCSMSQKVSFKCGLKTNDESKQTHSKEK